uniref:Parathyroid hormone n=1 Tax=Sphenodon punctatus TaxID=8508 RepID=A0A8D0G5V7_SPHPU
MISIRDMAKTAMILYAVCFFAESHGKPVTKRSVSEVQLMHDRGEHRHTVERQEWLQERLQNVHSGSLPAPEALVNVKTREIRSRKLLPEHLRAIMQKKPIDLDKAYLDILLKTKSQ